MNFDRYTIAIPTFERGDALRRCFMALRSQPHGEEVRILVSDNCSEDGSWEAIQDLGEFSNVRLFRNDMNLGFQGNLLMLPELVDTEYIVVLSDEDDLDLNCLHDLDNLITSGDTIDFISPHAVINGKVYRGVSKLRDLKGLEFFQASCYLSGLVYRVEAMHEAINKLGRDELAMQGQVYPQCAITAAIMACGHRAVWHPAIFAKKREHLPTRINDGKGAKGYNSLEGRVGQLGLFHDLFDRMASEASSDREAKQWHQIRDAWMQRSYNSIRNGFAKSYPEYIKIFARGWFRYTVLGKIIWRVRKLLSS